MFETAEHNEHDPFANQSAQPGVTLRDQTPQDRMFSKSAQQLEPAPASTLDSPQIKAMHRRLLGHYVEEMDRQAPNRREMALDEKFYDNHQWDEIDKALLKSRGQVPLTFNITATAINWMLGTERRGRTDYRILARRKEATKAAERKTDVFKYLSDVNRSEFAWSAAFAETVKAGVSWMEGGVQDDIEGEPVYDRHESWRNIIYDSAARELDMKDARYLFRPVWTDVDTAATLFPARARLIQAGGARVYDSSYFLDDLGDPAMDEHEDMVQNTALGMMRADVNSGARNRIRLIEAWYRVPVMEDRLSGGQFRGEIFDPQSKGHIREVSSGQATVRRGVTFRVHVMIMTNTGVLWASKSPYRHNRFPFTPVWCYRESGTGLPYGVIRNIRDIQRDINKRATKSLHLLSTSKVIADDDAVEDWEEFEEEVARPDAIIRKKKGSDIQIHDQLELGNAHMELMSRDISMIQQVSGITDEALGRTTNAVSGKAIVARQEQGALATAPIFDNLRLARQVHGEKMLSLVEQYMTQTTEFRVAGPRGNAEFRTINSNVEDDIVSTKADFVITEDDWNATLRQTQAQQFFELLTKLAPVAPEVVLKLLDLAADMMDVPMREEVVARIRSITGAKDPDADPDEPPTEEEKAQQEAKKMESDMMMRGAMAEIAGKEAAAAEKMAKAKKTAIEAARTMLNIEADEIDKQHAALTLASIILAEPGVAPIADIAMREAQTAGIEKITALTQEPQQPQTAMQ
jgi:hypothetical protein